MKKLLKILICALFALSPVLVFSQNSNELKVFTFQGKIDKYPISMLLWINKKNEVNGAYVYQKVAQFITLNGTVDNTMNITLNEFDADSNITATFQGKTDNNWTSINGTWTTTDKKKNLPFLLTQIKPNDDMYKIPTKKGDIFIGYSIYEDSKLDLPFNVYNFSLNWCMNNDCDNHPSFSDSNTLMLPKKGTNIQNFDKVFKNSLNTLNFLKYLTDNYNDYCSDLQYYDSTSEDIYMYKYEYTFNVQPDYYFNNFLIFSENDYSYSGGAHGNYGVYYTTYDLKTGDSITLKSIFLPNSIQKISNIIVAETRVDSLEFTDDYFFDRDSIQATDNFVLDKDKITFVYNPYEIACYAVGVVSIPVSYKKLSPYLQPWFKQRMGVK